MLSLQGISDRMEFAMLGDAYAGAVDRIDVNAYAGVL